MGKIGQDELINLFYGNEMFVMLDEKNCDFSFEGENRKKVLMVCYSRTNEIPSEEREMLVNLLGAIKLELADIALIIADKVPPFSLLKKNIRFDKLILFGFSASDLKLNFALVKKGLVNFQSTELLFTADTLTLLNDKSSRAALWSQLQILFKVK